MRLAILSLLGFLLASAAPVLSQVTPVRIATSVVSRGCTSIEVSGRYLYVGNNFNYPGGQNGTGLTILDISDPFQPVDVGFNDYGLHCDIDALSGGYLYTATGIRELSNPRNPVTVGQIPGRVAAVSDKLAYSQLWSGMFYFIRLFDVSDPASPVPLGDITNSGPVAVSGKYVYVAGTGGQGGLSVYEVSDPLNPKPVGGTWSWFNYDLAISGSHAYLAAYTNGIWVYDISSPANPVIVTNTPAFARTLRISGNLAYTLDGYNFVVWDISNPTNLTRLGSCGMPGSYAEALAASGNYVYVAHADGWSIYSLGMASPSLSISQTSTNTLVLSWPTPTAAVAVQQSENISKPNWVMLTNAPAVVASRNQVIIPVPQGPTFYRLVSM